MGVRGVVPVLYYLIIHFCSIWCNCALYRTLLWNYSFFCATLQHHKSFFKINESTEHEHRAQPKQNNTAGPGWATCRNDILIKTNKKPIRMSSEDTLSLGLYNAGGLHLTGHRCFMTYLCNFLFFKVLPKNMSRSLAQFR